MTILVTGSNGMIGYQLVKALLKAGHIVIGVDRAGEENSNIDNFYFYKIDLSDKDLLQRIVDINKVDRIIHLAALAHTEGEKDTSWSRYKFINVDCAKNVFSVAKDRPVLFISTIDVFGFYDGKKPVDGKSRVKPVSSYGKSKAMAEEECKKLKCFSIFRFSPVYTDEIKRDIQKRYYFRYPEIAYQIGKGSKYEILNINKAVQMMVDWCTTVPQNDVTIIKDDKPMWTPDYIKAEKEAGRAKIVLRIPRCGVRLGYFLLKGILGENEKTYLLNKAVYPLRSKNNDK